MAIWDPFTRGYSRENIGRTIGAIGGMFGATPLRDIGGQMTGGQRTFNWIPPARAYSEQAPTPEQTTTGGVVGAEVPSGTTATTGEVLGTAAETTTTEPTGPSAEEQLQSEVAAIFDPVFAALSGQKTQVAGERTLAEADVAEQYGLSRESLAGERETGETALTRQEKEAGVRKEDALTSATRLYSELTRGGRQRFGGATSAGEAYQALTAVEQQRRRGTVRTQFENAMQKIGGYKADLQKRFDLALRELEVQKNTAMRDVQREFDRAMGDIRTNEALAESDKAAATLETLQDLRNKVYTINLQTLQFQQALSLNRQQSEKYVDDYTQQVIQSVTGGATTVSGLTFPQATQTAYGGLGGTQQPATQQYIGQISRRDEEDFV